MTTDPDSVFEDLFSDYRTEWTKDLFGSLFVKPPYFSQLMGVRPCVLIGGRGTGKTTALRSLRFDSLEARIREGEGALGDGVGVYVRFNKNRVSAFAGAGMGKQEWSQAFAHYFNLLVCQDLCGLAAWLSGGGAGLQGVSLDLVETGEALGLAATENAADLETEVRQALVKLQLYVNNPQQVARPIMSMAEAPIRSFIDELHRATAGNSGVFYVCLDEYENLLEYQQAVINTYIKHAEPPLSYKVGIRKSGIKTWQTIDRDDLLSVPDDYFEIDIGSASFESFAGEVVAKRLGLAVAKGLDVADSAEAFLQKLTTEQEADLLGAGRIAERVRSAIADLGDEGIEDWVKTLPDAQAYFLAYWAESEEVPVAELAADWCADPTKWRTRLGNYQFASLFWLAKGRKGVRIRKYYCGQKTLLGLASGNIRYFLELLDVAIANQIGLDSSVRPFALSPRAQTDAAVSVGKRRLFQIEGRSQHGPQLQRLVLAIGKVFFEFARDPAGHTPETTAFLLSGSPEARAKLQPILSEGVSHLVLEATPSTKATSETELREMEYRLHPIFCAFFWFSHRRKRRAVFSADKLLQLDTNPKSVIKALTGRPLEKTEEDTPGQLSMFSPFYEGGDE